MTGREYEYAVARYLRWHGFSRTDVTQSSGDYGVDVIAVRRRERYAVQCKYYGHPVGIAAVQEAVAGMASYGCAHAMVVTNTTFTRAAHRLAEDNDVELWERVEPLRHARPLPSAARVLLGLLWTGGGAALLWCQRERLPLHDARLRVALPALTLVLLALPLWIGPAARLFRWLWWRAGMGREVRREQRTLASAEQTEALLSDLGLASSALEGLKGPEAFVRGRGSVDTRAVCARLGAGPLLRRWLCRLAQERSFTLRQLQGLTGLSREDALRLADSMIGAGFWLCARPMRYAWTAQAMEG